MVSISIIIPIYNVERYIHRCLESIIAQNTEGLYIDCLIVNDGTLDNSMEVVHCLLYDYFGPIRFEIIEHDENLGLSAARNTGLFHATGDYILFVDSDDYLLPGCIAFFRDNLAQYPNVDIVVGNVKACKTGDLLIQNIKEPWFVDDPDVFFRLLLHHQIYLSSWNKLIKRELLTKNNIIFEDGILFEDQCWSYLLFSLTSSMVFLPQVTYVYEFNPNSIVNTTQTAEKAEKVIWSYTVSTNKLLDNPPDSTKYRSNLIVDYLLFMVNFLMYGVDILSKFPISDKIKRDFLDVRMRLLAQSLHYRRFILFLFLLILFPPLSYMQKFRFFRHHYYDLESVVNKLCHLTDFIHRK